MPSLEFLLDVSILLIVGIFNYYARFSRSCLLSGVKSIHRFSLVLCLYHHYRLSSKSTYKKTFDYINQYADIDQLLNLPKTVVDSGEIIHEAVRGMWPKVKVNGCRLHMRQAWWCKMQSFEVNEIYNE